jgi:hypothetical protein
MKIVNNKTYVCCRVMKWQGREAETNAVSLFVMSIT